MEKFHNILLVTQNLTDEHEPLKQAMSVARNNHAALKILTICPELPKEIMPYQDKYELFLKNQLNQTIEDVFKVLNISKTELNIETEISYSNQLANHVIRTVIKESYDLVIKGAAFSSSEKGFKAVDMQLLRKCPCSLWLSRPIQKHRDQIKVAVAIDPEDHSKESYDLSIRLLALSRLLADSCNGKLSIISCWDYEYEEFLRHNMWINIADDKINEIVENHKNSHHMQLVNLIEKSGIQGDIVLEHARGEADLLIPNFVNDNSIDILVMGTVGRTGIPGFIMGNTAESIVQRLNCSLLALKPNGFVSPVKAY